MQNLPFFIHHNDTIYHNDHLIFRSKWTPAGFFFLIEVEIIMCWLPDKWKGFKYVQNMCEVKHGQTNCGCRAVKNSKYLTYDYEVGLNCLVCLGQKRNTPPKPWICGKHFDRNVKWNHVIPTWWHIRRSEAQMTTSQRGGGLDLAGTVVLQAAIKSKCALVASVMARRTKSAGGGKKS